MRYYSTQRPVAPGTFPKPKGNKVLEIHNFDDMIYCEEIGREAWGYINYEKPLARYDSDSYELVPAQTKTLHLRYIGTDSWGRYVYEDENGKHWKLLDCCSPREVCEKRGDTPCSSCNNAFDGEPDCPMPAHIKPEYCELVAGAAPRKTYTVEVTSVVTLDVEAEDEDQAIEKACGEAWEYDADELNARIIE